MTERPLAGYRVVELGNWVAGPGAGGVMADWGADVIKVEPPHGDPMRQLFKVIGGHLQPQSPPFDLDNRGKRSVVLNLRDGAEFHAFMQLLSTADVFLTNLRPDALERQGLDAVKLTETHPRIVYCSVTGYGLQGVDMLRPGYDVGAFAARSGFAHLHGAPYGEPLIIRAGVGDHFTAMTAVGGIVAALLHRERTGKGQLVSTSLLRTGMYALGWDLGIHLRFGKLAPAEPRTRNANPLVNSYRAADDRWFWLLGLESDRHWPALVKAIDNAEATGDERFADARGRRKSADACIAMLDAEFATRPADEWFTRFDDAGVWWAPVQTPAEVLSDPQALAAGAVVDVPEGAGAPAHQAVATPIDFSAADSGPSGAVPGLGEHTDQVLGELREKGLLA